MSRTPIPSTWEKRINGYAARPSMSFDGPMDQAPIAPSNFGDKFPGHATISAASTLHFPTAASRQSGKCMSAPSNKQAVVSQV